jgi:glutamyl-tRNA synthetase
VYAALTASFLAARGLDVGAPRIEPVVSLIRERATTFADAADRLDFVFRDPPAIDAPAAAKFLVAASVPVLRGLADAIATVEPWTAPALEAAVNAWLPSTGLPMKDVAQPARVALTGRTASPGLFDVIAVLGRSAALARLRAAVDGIRV